MRLPNANKAIIPPEKLRDYILSFTHPVGKFKAAFFQNLGYNSDNWQQLEADIRSIIKGNDATAGEKTEYGLKYEVRGIITGKNLQAAEIVTAWILLNGEYNPRFITAYPGD